MTTQDATSTGHSAVAASAVIDQMTEAQAPGRVAVGLDAKDRRPHEGRDFLIVVDRRAQIWAVGLPRRWLAGSGSSSMPLSTSR